MRFVESCGGEAVYKTFTSPARVIDGKSYAVYTNRLTLHDVEQRADQLSVAPCLLQEYVPKDVELRITVIGSAVFTDEIRSQEFAGTKEDWRRHYMEHQIHHASDLSADVKDRLKEMLKRLGLVFGCFDMVRTPSGELVFLEINPNGQWYWIEALTGMPLADAFAGLLAKGRFSFPSSAHWGAVPAPSVR